MSDGLSAREVATIVGVPESRIRYWAQIGLVGPTYRPADSDGTLQRPMYAFSDLVAAKAARELTERGIAARRVREAIIALRAQLPTLDRPLLHLRVLSDGDRLVVAGDQPYEPLTGQRVMDFALDELSREVARLDGEKARERDAVPRPIAFDLTRREPSGPERAPKDALGWFEEGLEAARLGEVERAREAYRAALRLDPCLGAAQANLGLLHAARGEEDAAITHLDSALLLDPGAIEARVARAALYERRGQAAEALALWASLYVEVPERPQVLAGLTRATLALERASRPRRSAL